MTRKIVDTSAKQPRIVDTSPTQGRIDPAVVAAALGAEPAGVTRERGGSPLSRFLLCAEIIKRLQPSGSRSAPDGTRTIAEEGPKSVAVPLSEHEWRQLESLTASLADNGFTPSAGQVASVLLSHSLQSFTEKEPQTVKEQLRKQILTETEAAR